MEIAILVLHGISRDSRRDQVGLHKPGGAVAEILEKLGGGGSFTPPNDFGVVDIGGIVDPVVKGDVARAVSHDGKLPPRIAFQLG